MRYSDKGDQPVPLPAPSAEHVARQESERGVEPQPGNSDSAPDAARLKKINDLKQAVADGTYHVSSEEVARKIIEHMLEPKE